MRYGIAFVVGWVMLAGVVHAQRARLPEVGVPGALGVNIHFTDSRPGEMEMLAAAGFRWVRMDLGWGGTERERGEYDFGAYDRLVKALEPHGIRAIFILDYSNRLYDGGRPPHTDEGRGAMARWAMAAARHFAGKGIVFEMWNEPNIAQFWKPKPNVEDYAKLAVAVGKAMRAEAPDELYVGPATSSIDLAFLEACFKAGCLEYWDAVSVHPYRQSDPETVEAEYRKLRALIARYAPKGKAIPILSGEWGYSTAWKGFDEARQGRYLPREFLVNLCNDVPMSIFYDWHDDGTDPKEAEHHFGTVRNEYVTGREPVYEPKPSYLAMKDLATELGGLAFNKRLWVGEEGDWVLLFSAGEKVRLAAWTTSKTPRVVTVPVSAGKFDVMLNGKRETVEARAEGLKLELTDTVRYVSPEGANEGLSAVARWERLRPEVAGGVDRSAGPRVVTSELQLAGGKAKQRVVWLVPDPILVDGLPPAGNELRVRVADPSARGFAGSLALTDVEGLEPARADVRVNPPAGQAEMIVAVPLKKHVGAAWSFGVKLYDAKPRSGPVVTVPRRTYRLVGGEFKVRADGDEKVTSSEVMDAAAPPEPTPAGGPVLRLKYEMERGWKFEQVMPASEAGRRIDGRPEAVGMWVYGDGSGNQIRVRFADAAGQTFQPDGPRVDWRGWRWVSIPIRGGAIHHWGKGDGEIHYPIRWDTVLLLDNVSREKVSGEIWVAGVVTVE